MPHRPTAQLSRRPLAIRLAPAALALFLASSAAAQNVWVDASAPPGGNGSQASPFTTIMQGVAVCPIGGTVRVAPGVYFENVRVTRAGMTLLASQGPLQTTIHGTGIGPVVELAGGCDCFSPFPRVQGFTITGGPSLASAWGTVQSHEGTLADCIVTGNPGYAYRNDWDGFVEGCTLAGNASGALIGFIGVGHFDRVALQNTDANFPSFNAGFWTNSVGTGALVPSNVLNADPGFWDPVHDHHLRPGAAAAFAGGVYAGALPPDPNYLPPSRAFCSSDGTLTDHTTACPCGNTGGAGRGCATGFNPAGALLETSGWPTADSVVLARGKF